MQRAEVFLDFSRYPPISYIERERQGSCQAEEPHSQHSRGWKDWAMEPLQGNIQYISLNLLVGSVIEECWGAGKGNLRGLGVNDDQNVWLDDVWGNVSWEILLYKKWEGKCEWGGDVWVEDLCRWCSGTFHCSLMTRQVPLHEALLKDLERQGWQMGLLQWSFTEGGR